MPGLCPDDCLDYGQHCGRVYAVASGHEKMGVGRHKPGRSDGDRPASSTDAPQVAIYG